MGKVVIVGLLVLLGYIFFGTHTESPQRRGDSVFLELDEHDATPDEVRELVQAHRKYRECLRTMYPTRDCVKELR